MTSWTEEDLARYQQRQAKYSAPDHASDRLKQAIESANSNLPAKVATSGKPNKTEAEYGRLLALEYPGAVIVFEGITFRFLNSHRYTPDWIVKNPDGQILCVEVKARGKNGFRLPSYQRAKLAFDQARVEYNTFLFRWAEKSGGIWNTKDYL